MAQERFVALDVMRGVAILGTLGTNIWIFTHPSGFAGTLAGISAASSAWEPVQAVLQQLTQGKFLGLLTIMFGVGLAIQQHSAMRHERPWPGSYPLRAGILLIDGILHYTFFTEFDVLTSYAITSVIVAFVLATGIRSQKIWLSCAAVAHLAIVAIVLAAGGVSGALGTASESTTIYQTGSFWQLAWFRWENLATFRAEAVFLVPMSIALFLAGALLFRAGVLEERGHRARRMALIVGVVAFPADFVAGLFGGPDGQFLARYVFAPLVAIGIFAAIAHHYLGRAQLGSLGRFFHPIGRTALTSYVLQNVLSGAVCYGWGLGLAGVLTPASVVPATIALYCAVTVALWLFATLWLRRFSQGPLEWLAKAAYARLQREH